MSHMCQKLSFVVLVIFTLVHVGSCLKCYICQEMNLLNAVKSIDYSLDPYYTRIIEDTNCGDPFINATIQVCDKGEVCTKVKTPDLGVIPQKVFRSCGAKDENGQVNTMTGSLNIVYSTCTTDLCNSASATSATFILGPLCLFMKLVL